MYHLRFMVINNILNKVIELQHRPVFFQPRGILFRALYELDQMRAIPNMISEGRDGCLGFGYYQLKITDDGVNL